MDKKAWYQFAEIPNNEEGLKLIAEMKKYLNPRYTIKVRGQHLKKGEDWKRYRYGQPLDKSECLRVYIEERKEKKENSTPYWDYLCKTRG